MTNVRTACTRIVSLALALACLAVPAARAQLTGPAESDPKVAKAVADSLEMMHLTRHKVDDEISRRCFQNFIKEFDSTKVFFVQQDIDEFRQHETLLDDELRQGDLSFAYQVRARFVERLKERVALVQELVRDRKSVV